jgi:hypothetical protein
MQSGLLPTEVRHETWSGDFLCVCVLVGVLSPSSSRAQPGEGSQGFVLDQPSGQTATDECGVFVPVSAIEAEVTNNIYQEASPFDPTFETISRLRRMTSS